MRTKLLLTFCLFLITCCAINAQKTSIAVQGIARDNNNTAIAGKTIAFKFEVYYGTNEVFIEEKNLTTDAFGVFSGTISVENKYAAIIAKEDVKLKIIADKVIISDELFKAVPYAIAAYNGVPTGSIMPYIGTTAPAGWLLCDGKTVVPNPSILYNLIGEKTPDLSGMFLRGAGGSGNHVGPDLNKIQEDDFKKHNHPDDITIAADGGAHQHDLKFDTKKLDNDDNDGVGYPYHQQGTGVTIKTNNGKDDGSHNHTVNGSVLNNSVDANFPGTETRPVNYGVNYIIKL